MKAISVKGSGIASNSVQRVLNLVGRHKLEIAVAGAVASFFGCLLSMDPAMYAGAVAAILAVRPAQKKGGCHE